jgi:APA family basic amino acid/polyamine antiporter
MAKKRPRLKRVLGGRDLFSIAYGEIASSIYFALGIVAAKSLGLTPALLLAVGGLFLVVALSYAEATTSMPESGGTAGLVRHAFNDLSGFAVGWVLLLDYLIVIALTTLFVPHYLASAFSVPSLRQAPYDTIVAVALVVGLTSMRLIFRPSTYRFGILLAVLDLATQILLIGLGTAFLFSGDGLASGVHFGASPGWRSLAFALSLAMLAFTGIETVANLSRESRDPNGLPRSLFPAIGAVIVVYALIAVVGLSAFPVKDGVTKLGTEWERAPLMGIVVALAPHVPSGVETALRVFVGLTAVTILLLAATTAISGSTRLARTLGEHGMLPAAFGRLYRRTLISPQTLIAVALIAGGLLVATEPLHAHGLQGQATFLAALFSFGVLVAFTVAQLAVIRLRYTEPARSRPYRVPLSIRVGGGELPIPALVGALLTAFVFVLTMITHVSARYGGPIWLGAGLLIFALVRVKRGAGLLEQVEGGDEEKVPEARFGTILVPMKAGEIGEEMMATAVKVAQDRRAEVIALNVIAIPLDRSLDDPTAEEERQAAEAIKEARALGEENGVPVRGVTMYARSIGAAVVEEARELGADLIILGSGARWRRHSRFFSPTVEYVLEKASCEVMVVSFPEDAFAALPEVGETGEIGSPGATTDGQI